MTLALAPEQKQFVAEMVSTGQFGSESEVVDEALLAASESQATLARNDPG